MKKGKKLYEGKAKIIYATNDKNLVIQYFKDDATAFNNQKKTTIEGKGVLNNRISEHILSNLSQIGIKNHLVKRLNMREQIIKLLEIIPIEFIVRNIGPDANITTDFALVRLTNILDNMIVYPKKMLENLNITKGLIFSQEVMLELTKTGLSREKSYRLVQSYAKKCFAENLNLIDVISSDKFIMSKISPKKLKSIFNYSKHFKNVNFIFRRVFK